MRSPAAPVVEQDGQAVGRRRRRKRDIAKAASRLANFAAGRAPVTLHRQHTEVPIQGAENGLGILRKQQSSAVGREARGPLFVRVSVNRSTDPVPSAACQ